MARLLHTLLEKIATERTVPRAMKESTVVLLHKKGPKADPMNYRPISLLQSTFKLLDA